MAHLKFDVAKIAKLDDPGRFETMSPEVMWTALGNPSPEVIIEIGAGTGLFSAKFAEMAPGASVYAVDTETVMLDWMREHRPEVAAGRIIPVLSEETTVPLGDGQAQLVAMLNLHHELALPEALYGEALRMLVPGGQLLVVDWAPIETPKGPPLAIRASANEIVELLATVGFASVRAHDGALPWHWLVTATRP
jgi:ubiquinone/menaquinone biosynthesis C-methylase UbiE